VANHATAGSITVPSFRATPRDGGQGRIRRVRLYSNLTTGGGTKTMILRFWSAAPTYTSGDNVAYALATGAASHLGTITVVTVQVADGIYCQGAPTVGLDINYKFSATQLIYWDIEATTGFTPISGQTFTLVPEIHVD